MAVVDTLVTRYVLDSKDYKQGASDVQSATGRLVGTFQLGIGAVTGLATGFAAAAGAVLASGGMAVKAASDWEVLNAQLAVVTGSFERAAEISKFADQLALPSAFFDTAQLAETAKLLETMQLQTERYLPIVSTMASLFGASTESLMGFASALGRIKAGSFGEGFERMREFGIAAKDLAAEGVTFKNGQFQLLDGEDAAAGADRALAAVEAVVKKRFGNMDAIMGDTMSARFATLGETMSKAFRIAGEAINRELKGPFDSFVTGFSNFVQGPEFKQLAENLAAAFDFEKIKDSVVRMLSTLVAGFKQLPSIITGIQSMIGTMWKVATQAAVLYVSIQAAAFGAEAARAAMTMVTVFQAMQAAAIGTAAATGATQAMLKNLAAISIGLLAGTAVFVGLQKMLQAIPGAEGGFVGFNENAFNADRDKIEQAILGSPSGSAGSSGSAFADAAQQAIGMGGAGSELKQQTGYLAAIERNTNPTQNQILGGGSIGAIGVTPQELGRATGRGKLDAAVKLIAEYVSDAQAKSGADFLKMANPFIGGR